MASDAVTDGGNCSSGNFEINWRVAAGSLERTVVLESSSEDSPLADSPPDSVYDASTPLVLKPEVADSGPCEIKICFLKKHEIRQIYVRSTARVYEVYYKKSWQSDNEYLCTVRCSIAERDDQVLQAHDSSESSESSLAELKEETLASEGNGGTSEDDWVEVKVLDSSLENKINSLSNKKNASIGRDIQDFYEATAAISDLDPCSSVTIRFLSLQNRSCLCVDEVYVFTDPVSEIDSDHQVEDVKGSVGSSILSLLAPTLLQLSKSGLSQIQSHQASSDIEKCSKIEVQSKPTDPTDLTSHLNEKVSNDLQSVNAERVDKSTTEPAETHHCNKILDGNKSDNLAVKDDSAYGRIEKVLEQLVCRVGRIEEVCLRFEENMLTPLRSMETRIERVEQKLEEIVNNSQHCEFPPCLKISAPSFSGNSNFSSFHTDGHDCQPCGVPESEKEEMTSVDLSNASGGITSSVNVPHLLPSLVVTAPDFSCEDGLDDDGTKSPKLSPQESIKKRSIDDVLAESLSRFLSASTGALSDPALSDCKITSDKVPVESAKVTDGAGIISYANAEEEPSRYTQVLTVIAPEFSYEENDHEDLLNYAESASVASPKFTQVLTVIAPEFSYEENDHEDLLNYAESASVASPKFTSKICEIGKDVNPEASEDVCSKASFDFSDTSRDRLVYDQASICGIETSAVFADVDGKSSNGISSGVADAENNVFESSSTCSFVVRSIDDKGQDGSNQIEPVNSLGFGKDHDFEPVSERKTDDHHIAVAAGSGTEYVADGGPDEEILQNLSEVTNASLVDFGIPILDVKFTPYEGSKTQLPLEALLDDAINQNIEAEDSQRISVQDAYPQETNFIDIHEDGETGDFLASRDLVMDQGIFGITFSSTKESSDSDSCSTGKQEPVASLI